MLCVCAFMFIQHSVIELYTINIVTLCKIAYTVKIHVYRPYENTQWKDIQSMFHFDLN